MKHDKALASVDKKREIKQCLPVAFVQGHRQIQEVGWTHGEHDAQHYSKGIGAKLPSREQGQVFGGKAPQQGPGAGPVVRESGEQSSLKLKIFQPLRTRQKQKTASLSVFRKLPGICDTSIKPEGIVCNSEQHYVSAEYQFGVVLHVVCKVN